MALDAAELSCNGGAMGKPLAVDRRGQRLTQLYDATEPAIDRVGGERCPLALVVVCHEAKVLLGLNRWRQEWELPGGVIDAQETPRMAATRELSEETGLHVAGDDLRWLGLAAFELLDPVRRELAAVYWVSVVEPPVPHASDELVEVGWFDVRRPPSRHAVLDLAIARRAQPGRL